MPTHGNLSTAESARATEDALRQWLIRCRRIVEEPSRHVLGSSLVVAAIHGFAVSFVSCVGRDQSSFEIYPLSSLHRFLALATSAAGNQSFRSTLLVSVHVHVCTHTSMHISCTYNRTNRVPATVYRPTGIIRNCSHNSCISIPRTNRLGFSGPLRLQTDG